MFRAIILSLFCIIFLTSCTNNKKEKLRIVTSNWLGYTPLIYAKEKGYLDKLNIEILNVVSLSESLYTFNSEHADVFMGTQYEYKVASEKNPNVIPIMLLNKSDGRDVVMSNKTLESLQKIDEEIDVFLELDSINSIVFEDFIKKHSLKNKTFNYINKDQSYISSLKEFKKSSIVITYNPYNIILEKNGLLNLETTKDSIDILIVDGMFTKNETLIKYKEELIELKNIIDIAVIELEKDPKKYYESIKDYLYDTNYDDFLESLSNIKWLNKNSNNDILNSLKSNNFPTKELL